MQTLQMAAFWLQTCWFKTELAPSKAEAKRLIKQGGISVNDEKVTAFDAAVSKDAFAEGHIILKKGKKVFHKVTIA